MTNPLTFETAACVRRLYGVPSLVEGRPPLGLTTDDARASMGFEPLPEPLRSIYR